MMTKEITKSMIQVPNDDIGRINRGKYILLIILASFRRLLLARVKPFEKNVHGNKPAYTKIG